MGICPLVGYASKYGIPDLLVPFSFFSGSSLTSALTTLFFCFSNSLQSLGSHTLCLLFLFLFLCIGFFFPVISFVDLLYSPLLAFLVNRSIRTYPCPNLHNVTTFLHHRHLKIGPWGRNDPPAMRWALLTWSLQIKFGLNKTHRVKKL